MPGSCGPCRAGLVVGSHTCPSPRALQLQHRRCEQSSPSATGLSRCCSVLQCRALEQQVCLAPPALRLAYCLLARCLLPCASLATLRTLLRTPHSLACRYLACAHKTLLVGSAVCDGRQEQQEQQEQLGVCRSAPRR